MSATTEEQRSQWRLRQNELKQQLVLKDDVDFDTNDLKGLKYVAGVDLSFPLNDNKSAIACLVVMELPQLEVVYTEFLPTQLHLPYISGYLAFREVDPLLTLLKQLKHNKPHLYPQIILVDGNGLLHPRQFGIASHLGVLSNTPTIGVAKNFLVIPSELDNCKEEYRKVLLNRGDDYILMGASSKIVYGTALRTSQKAMNPVFVSQGHRVTLDTAIKVVLAVSPNHRIPEPIRAADLQSRAYIRENPFPANHTTLSA